MSDRRPSVVLVNRCFVLNKGRLLLIRRSPTDRNNPGQWECPGGKVDEGQDITHAQEREVMEETGLLVKPTFPLAFIESFIIGDKGKYKGQLYLALFSITKVIGGKFKLSEEHTAHKWALYEEMLDMDITLQVRKAAIELEEHLV